MECNKIRIFGLESFYSNAALIWPVSSSFCFSSWWLQFLLLQGKFRRQNYKHYIMHSKDLPEIKSLLSVGHSCKESNDFTALVG